uniref:Uncharacterized protein n=1 Tax=Oryza meridionalis TaxID=40149 RepID=A0A0E0CXA1_9ORYZ
MATERKIRRSTPRRRRSTPPASTLTSRLVGTGMATEREIWSSAPRSAAAAPLRRAAVDHGFYPGEESWGGVD